MKPRIHLIAAVGNSGQLGRDGKLPWHSPADLQWFKERTTGKTILEVSEYSLLPLVPWFHQKTTTQTCIIGYNTAQTIPPLPGREVYVMQRRDTPERIMEAFDGTPSLWIIGGAATYRKWMPFVDVFDIARIRYDGEADVLMPELCIWNNKRIETAPKTHE